LIVLNQVARQVIEARRGNHPSHVFSVNGAAPVLLARLEGEVLLSVLARKVASIEPTAEPKGRYNNTLRGFASMPVALPGS
jgi:hypothetical protein